MAKKSDKITVNALENAVKQNESVHTITWNGLEIKVKNNISFDEMRLLVSAVVESCFSEIGEYRPEFREFVTRALVLSLYTNVTLPKSLDAQYNIVYSGIVDEVFQYINYEQYNHISWAIDRKIDLVLKENIDALNKQRKQLDEDMDNMRKLVDGIDPEDIENLVSAFSKMNITEEGLMQAYLNNKPAPDSIKE